MRDGAAAARWAHNPQVASSNLAPATRPVRPRAVKYSFRFVVTKSGYQEREKGSLPNLGFKSHPAQSIKKIQDTNDPTQANHQQ